MKKQFITRVFLSSLVLALTSLFGGGNLLAQESSVTFDFSEYASGTNVKDVTLKIDGITISSNTKNTNGNNDRFWSYKSTLELRTYKDNILSVKAETGKTIKSVTFVTKSNFSLNTCFTVTPNGSINGTTWTVAEDASSTNEVSFECTANMTQKLVTGITVTYTSTDDPSDTRTNPELAYGVSEYNATIGQTEGFPTLSHAENVEGIVYESSNTDVATVNETTGEVSLTGAVGTTVIKASISGSTTWKDDEASYTLNVSKPSANLAYSASSCHVVIGEAYTLPKLTYTAGVTGIVFDSSDKSVATVDAEGVVTLTGSVGKTTITASLKGDATYADGSDSYTLTVKKPNLFVYKKVTSAEDLVDGGVYIMVCDKLNSTISAIESNKGTPTDVTISGDIVEAITGNVVEFTLEDKDTYYRFKNNKLYLYGKSKTDIGLKALGTDDDQKWNVTIDKDKEVTKISCLKDGITDRQIGVNTDNANKFGLYSDYNTSKFPGINLYRKVYPLTVSSATGGYATFYNEEEAYKMPEGLTGYAVTKAEKDNYIIRKTAYEAGDTVPAKTPLLIIGTTDGGIYYPAVVPGTGLEAYAGSNLLEGKRDANGNTQSANKNVYYYKLGLNAEKQLGFYWGAKGGDAFQMQKATTAYLAVPKTLVEGANALFFDFGPETGINEIQTEQADKAIFDLSGRRVQKATKGFYIVGGKKVLVK
ncbi:MAG: hypothetical protein MR605_08220 [Bacteroidales bacterium]|nr:hypothetical protein [Bacteroidales bacterium]